jgi:hypothetical protein
MSKRAVVECDFSEEVVKQKDLLFCIVDRRQPVIQGADCDKFPSFGDICIG